MHSDRIVEQVTENTEIILNTNGGTPRYHTRIKGSRKMSKPVSKRTAKTKCKEYQNDIDKGFLKR